MSKRRRLTLATPGPILALAAAILIPPGCAAAQDPAPVADSVEARGGAGFFIPLGSLFVPGLGQYLHGATGPGLAFTGTGIAGVAINQQAGGDVDTTLPRDGEEQLATSGALLFAGAGLVSAYDAFRRGLPGLQREGKYQFLTGHASTRDLLTAPFDPDFLGRWTTWVELAYTGAITAIVLSDRDEGVEYEPLKGRDVAFATGLSFYAGIGEEALFRGWLLPVFHQSFGERFWVANGVQALLFGAGHVGSASEYAAVIGAWALYEGWLTRRNDWSIRESIFHHFWYDVAVVTAELLTDEREPVTLVFPTIRF